MRYRIVASFSVPSKLWKLILLRFALATPTVFEDIWKLGIICQRVAQVRSRSFTM